MKKVGKVKSLELGLIVIGILIVVLGIFLTFNNNDNGAKKDNPKNNKLNIIKTLMKNDHDISNYMYGSPSVSEESVAFHETTYYRLNEGSLTNISSYQKLINETYTDNLLATSLADMDKYNKYVEVEKNLYVNINSKCNIDKFDDKVSIVSETDNTVTVKTNNREITISKDGNVYRLKDSAYDCKKQS